MDSPRHLWITLQPGPTAPTSEVTRPVLKIQIWRPSTFLIILLSKTFMFDIFRPKSKKTQKIIKKHFSEARPSAPEAGPRLTQALQRETSTQKSASRRRQMQFFQTALKKLASRLRQTPISKMSGRLVYAKHQLFSKSHVSSTPDTTFCAEPRAPASLLVRRLAWKSTTGAKQKRRSKRK